MGGHSRARKYMGVDIERGSPQSRSSKPLYHVVIIDESGRTLESHSGITLARLIRLAWYHKPARIAFDNVLELAPNRRALERILELFPPESEIVQVTIGPSGLVSLRELSAPYRDLVGPGKLRPGKAAYVLALLASKGHGATVRTVESKTLIIVSKARSPTGGGFSQQRYQRRVRASVLNAAMRVKEALDRAGLEYDMSYRRSEGGLESAVFTVYASRDRLRGVVRPHRGVDYQVVIKPEYRVRLSLPGGDRSRDQPVIVGIDPGITTGIAVIDLQGRVLYLASGKGLDRGRIVETVTGLGRPIIVAVDVPNPPEAVRKIAASLGAVLYSPGEELSVPDKRALAEKALGRQPQDSHQRDALAAAYKAYQLLQGKLSHIEAQLRRIGIDLDPSRVKEAVIRGLSLAEALEEAIEERLGEIESGAGAKARREEKPCPSVDTRLVASLESEIEALRRALRDLREENERLRIERDRAASRVKVEAYRDELVRRLESELEALQEEAERLRSRVERYKASLERLEEISKMLWRGDAGLAARIPSLTLKNLKRASDLLGGLAGEIIAVDEPVFEEEALSALRKTKPLGIVVLSGGYQVLARRLGRWLVPVLAVRGDEVLYSGRDFVVLDGGVVGRLEEEKRRLEDQYYSERALERMIEEYRKMRMRGGLRRA